MNGSIIGWGAAIVVFAVAEAATAGLVSIWFALGAAAALICALLGGQLWLQVAWFVVISVATLLLTRPLARKFVDTRIQPTNADRLIGRTGLVTAGIDNVAAVGTVRIEGQEWTARSADGSVIPEGERVVAKEIRGVKLIVRKEE